jgi:hypothetical protein
MGCPPVLDCICPITYLVRKKPIDTPTDKSNNDKTCAVSVESVRYARNTNTNKNNEN